ncbi:TetR/AcrR family transcriptional regulator [Nonomuraea typhae]|uniref:TetR/AcrR family transcriptional regulator n=1 Tax=Nonomuraea typhae TaxID=2603600 RepID=UPI0012FCEFCE|nr:TetR/AcrR family transcriptional regulator [Nonomuraea typhae]
MTAVKTRRELYAESTRQALIDTGRRLFAERGYAAVSAEELVRHAGLTRGALYHHFDGKQGLFEAVFEELEESAVTAVTAAMTAAGAPEIRVKAGLGAYWDACASPEYREIVLKQAPAALGRERWRELDERHFGGLLREALRTLMEEGFLARHPVDLLSRTLFATITELALAIAEADDPATAREEADVIAAALLSGLGA